LFFPCHFLLRHFHAGQALSSVAITDPHENYTYQLLAIFAPRCDN